MPKGWSRVVRETPKTAPGQAEEREAGTNRDCEARRLGSESWTRGEAEAGAAAWRTGVTVVCTSLGQTTLSTAPLGM